MTVSSSTNRVSYSGNGTLTTFAYTFKVFDQGDLTVILRSSTGTETVQTITTHYTVTGVGDVGGGNVVFVTAPSATETVVILREQDLTQGLDLVPNDPFPAQSLEESLDKLTFMVQQHEEELGRAIKASRTNTLTGSEFTISAADRANKVFSFDSSGDLSVTQELGTFKGDWAASTAYVERDLVKDTTTNNVFIVTSAHTSSGSLPLTTNTNSAKYEKIIDITNPPGDVTFGGSITTSSSVTAGSFVIGSADINENDLEAIDEVIAGTVAASKAVVVDVNKDISSFRNLTATGNITFGSLSDGTITVTAFVDEDNMASDSATLVPTQQSVKAYVDAQVATADTLTEILGNGNTTSGANIQMTTTDELQFRDTALKISSSVDGQLDIDADTEVEITAPTVDINASTEVNISGAAKIGGTLNIDTIDELTTDAGTTINSTFIGNNKIGIGTSVVGDTQVAIRGSAAKLRLESTSVGNHNWDVGVFTTSFRIYHQATGQNPLWINSSDNVGIGTTSPSTKLDVNGTVTATGGAFTGDVSFGDNDKAIFGAGSDLQIYSDGANSIIQETDGTGNLLVRASNINLQNSGATATLAQFIDGGKSSLRYNGSEKLATTSTGIDVTGTVTADGLTVDGTNDVALITTNQSNYTEGLTLRNTANWGYGTSLSFEAITSSGGSNAEVGRITSTWNTTGYHGLDFYTLNNNTLLRHMRLEGDGDFALYEDTGTTAKFFWDASAEHLGVGTASPAVAFHVDDNSSGEQARISSSSTSGTTLGFRSTSTNGRNYRIGSNFVTGQGEFSIYDDTAGAERMRISSGGKVIINGTVEGSTGYADLLTVSNTAGNGGMTIRSANTAVGSIFFSDVNANSGSGAYAGFFQYSHAVDAMLLGTSSTERMRIDSSGNVLVGTTSNIANVDSSSGEGIALSSGSYGGFIGASRASDIVAILNRQTSDGDILLFRKDGTNVGSIGVYSGDITVGNGNAGLIFNDAVGLISPWDMTANAVEDNAIDLGYSGGRFKDLYLSGGVYLGGTGASNKLDDYESGTWTPALRFGNLATGITYGNQYATYTKIGNRVTVDFNIRLTSKGTSTGYATIAGLPFNAKNNETGTTEPYSSGVLVLEGNGSSFPQKTTYILPWSDGVLYLRANGSTGLESITNSNFSDTTEIYGTVTYRVA